MRAIADEFFSALSLAAILPANLSMAEAMSAKHIDKSIDW
jgi:hypothetical protein